MGHLKGFERPTLGPLGTSDSSAAQGSVFRARRDGSSDPERQVQLAAGDGCYGFLVVSAVAGGSWSAVQCSAVGEMAPGTKL